MPLSPARFAALLALGATLAGCASLPLGRSLFRQPNDPIWSNAVVTPKELSGQWVQALDFASPKQVPCAQGQLSLTPEGSALRASGEICVAGKPTPISGLLTPSGQGRFKTDDGFGQAGGEWWVLWVDTNNRTLLIGTPGGQFGLGFDRKGALPADRREAAVEILSWNGYDLSQARFRP